MTTELKKYGTDPTTWSHARQIAQLKIEQANRDSLDAYCKLWTARSLMKEAGVSDEGLAQIDRALHETGGWSPEDFMPDFLESEKFAAYFDYRYHETAYVDADDLANAIAEYSNHKQTKQIEIRVIEGDDLLGRTFHVRFTFHNDGRRGFIDGGKS